MLLELLKCENICVYITLTHFCLFTPFIWKNTKYTKLSEQFMSFILYKESYYLFEFIVYLVNKVSCEFPQNVDQHASYGGCERKASRG